MAKMPPPVLRNFRLKELARLFDSRYGGACLPDDDAGRGDLKELLLAHATAPNCTSTHLLKIASDWAPGLDATKLIAKVLATPMRYRRRKADKLGESLYLRFEERDRLGIRTFRCIDKTAAEITAIRRERKTDYERARRRDQGVVERDQWLKAHTTNRDKPWLALGMSRRTWYRKGKPTSPTPSGTGLRTHRKRRSIPTHPHTCATEPAPLHMGFQAMPGAMAYCQMSDTA